MPSPTLKHYAHLLIGTALATIVLKVAAWRLTSSVGLLSDALESGVNLAGAVMALAMISLATLPPDNNHQHRHSKAEYFSSGFEGLLILAAALGTMIAAVTRLLNPQALEHIGIGLIVSVLAALINFATARILLAACRSHHAIVLEADAQHLMSDVWISVAVVIGIGAAAVTGWLWLDPVLALLVSINIARTGWRLVLRSASGLMNESLPASEQARTRYQPMTLNLTVRHRYSEYET